MRKRRNLKMRKIMMLVLVSLLAIGCSNKDKPMTCFKTLDGKSWVTAFPEIINDPSYSSYRDSAYPCPNCECLPFTKVDKQQ